MSTTATAGDAVRTAVLAAGLGLLGRVPPGLDEAGMTAIGLDSAC